MTHASSIPLLIACVVGGYLLGSIPFGVIATRLGGAGNLREIGSGSIGATNVLRTGRRDLALITLVADAAKGAVAVLIAAALTSTAGAAVAGGAAFLGHLFPVWLRFRGGKGVATALGILLAAAWPLAMACGAIWLGVAIAFRYSSLAALATAALAPVVVILMGGWASPLLWLTLFMATLIFVRHRENIARLIEGKESRISLGQDRP
jgi:glycerol-3-phosphate acyltransferase PlsY